MACDTGVPAVPSTKLAKFLCIPSAPGDRKRSSVNTGARVLTSTECVEMLEEKERKKRQAAELKEKRKVDREERKKKKALEAQERANRKKGIYHTYLPTILPFLSSGTKLPRKNIATAEEICEATPCSVSMCDQLVVEWVQCDSCSKWFHLFCINIDRVHDDWVCECCV